MSVMRNIFMHTFGRPQGVLGRLDGIIMARMNADCGAWVSDLLEVAPNDSVLEVGFGPGLVIQRLSNLAAAGRVAGIDQSWEMVEQARARNATAIQSDRVDLRHGSVESLPFDDNSIDKAVAINSMQVWPDAVAGLREIRRVMKPGGSRLALRPHWKHLRTSNPVESTFATVRHRTIRSKGCLSNETALAIARSSGGETLASPRWKKPIAKGRSRSKVH